MKRSITATGLLSLVAMILVGAFSTGSALAGGGPNSYFLWSGPLPGLLLVLATNAQVFKATEALEVVCKHFQAHGLLSNGKAMTTKETIIVGTYTGCEAPAIPAPATVTTAEFLVSADGSVGVVNKPIVITVPAIGCSIKITNGSPNNNLRLLLYLNQTILDVLAHVEVGKITSIGSNGLCGEAGVEKTTGIYRGLFLVSVDGGRIQWDPGT
jgi:hypothetical protein